MAQRHCQLLEEGMPKAQCDNVLAELREQQIKPPRTPRLRMPWPRNRVQLEEDDTNEEAVAIAGLVVAWEAG